MMSLCKFALIIYHSCKPTATDCYHCIRIYSGFTCRNMLFIDSARTPKNRFFPSQSELTYKAKILFEEVITFARKKSHKSQQLICNLQKVQDNDVHELTLSKYKRLRLGPCMYITYILM